MYDKWFLNNTESLKNKTVAITGATGGIGEPLCKYLLHLEANLILMDRNKGKSLALKESLQKEFKNAKISHITVDLSSMNSVKAATEELKNKEFDYFIHNAGAYSIPRFITVNGFDNVFHINFVAPYYIIRELLPYLSKRNGRVVVTGSIAHRYSKTEKNDFDFRNKKQASLVYGNSKRFLMFSLYELFKDNQQMLSVVHPGITFTGITNHYNKFIFALIKHPMKVIFMKPYKACLSTLLGIFKSTPYCYWIGPKYFDIWGLPKISRLKIEQEEIKRIAEKAEEIYKGAGSNIYVYDQ